MDQSTFATALLDPAAPVPPGLTDPLGRPAGKRFNVYRNNVTASLVDALETGFPVLRKLLGEKSFQTLALMAARHDPPRSRQLSHYGAALPDLIGRLPALSAYPYLSDMARLELALRESYHAADHDPLDTDGLSPDALMDLTPCLAPSTRIIASPHPILSIWRRNSEAEAPKPTPRAETVLIARPAFDPVPHLLPAGGVPFAEALTGHTPMALALERAIEAAPGLDVTALLTVFLTSGALCLPTTGDR